MDRFFFMQSRSLPFFLPALLSALLTACQGDENPGLLADANSGRSAAAAPLAETTPALAGAANDPAIWIDAQHPRRSLILGSGLEIYDLGGTRIDVVDQRQISLVDVRYHFPLAGSTVSLIAAYDAAAAELAAYTIDPEQQKLREITAGALPMEAEIEGLCLYQSPLSGKFYAFAAGDGVLQQWEFFDQDGAVSARRVRHVPVGLGVGHCAVHDRSSAVYFSLETVGVFRLNAEPESGAEMQIVDVAQPFGHFAGDIKGIAIHEQEDGGHLIVSDADAGRLQFYDLNTLQHAGTVAIDSVEDAEGIAATSMSVMSGAAGGLLVVSDDGEPANYKIMTWNSIVDALGLAVGAAHDPTVAVQGNSVMVSASVETEPVASFGDAADDPAIWVHPDDPELSIVIGSQKKRGINVYDLSGKLLQTRADGRINNIDLRYGFRLNDQPVAVVTGSNRSTDSISVYIVDKDSRTLTDAAAGLIDTGMTDPYGLCMYRSAASGLYYVFVNDTSGLVRQWVLADNGQQRISMSVVREFQVGSQTEGCVADDDTGDLYIGEENVGIWKYSAEPGAGNARTLVDGVGDSGHLTADVEGLAIFYGPAGSGYLIASNQGADNYALYERSANNRFLGFFHVVADALTGIDGISETDGLDVSSLSLGAHYPDGVFVAQDGRNIGPDQRQNFKLVPWGRISRAMGLDQP